MMTRALSYLEEIMELKLEINQRAIKDTPVFESSESIIMITPPIDEDFWLARVPVSDAQSIVCFPKFGTIGIGFQVEAEDWNTNLPSSCDANEIFEHIKVNKGDGPNDSDCVEAIRLLQKYVKERHV